MFCVDSLSNPLIEGNIKWNKTMPSLKQSGESGRDPYSAAPGWQQHSFQLPSIRDGLLLRCVGCEGWELLVSLQAHLGGSSPPC